MSAAPNTGRRPLLNAANGTDQRLDLVLEELRAIRAALEPKAPELPAGVIELREPAVHQSEPERRKPGWPKGKSRGART